MTPIEAALAELEDLGSDDHMHCKAHLQKCGVKLP
jgi:hypothetical protein